jgi:hypothetical protein
VWLIELPFGAKTIATQSGGATIRKADGGFTHGFVAATSAASVSQDTANRAADIGATWLCRVRSSS